jgi:hypothetical protein
MRGGRDHTGKESGCAPLPVETLFDARIDVAEPYDRTSPTG